MEAFLKNFDLVPQDLRMILLGAVLFVVLWKLLQAVLFAPYIKLLEAREAASTGAQATAQRNNADAQETLAKYNEELTAARVAFMGARNEAIERAREQADQIVGKAEHEVRQTIEAAHKEVSRDLEAVAEVVQREAEQLGNTMANQAQSLATGNSSA
jgi:F-type H+-transporting ATPase subunit b